MTSTSGSCFSQGQCACGGGLFSAEKGFAKQELLTKHDFLAREDILMTQIYFINSHGTCKWNKRVLMCDNKNELLPLTAQVCVTGFSWIFFRKFCVRGERWRRWQKLTCLSGSASLKLFTWTISAKFIVGECINEITQSYSLGQSRFILFKKLDSSKRRRNQCLSFT